MSLRPLARAALTNSAWSAASLPPPGAWEHVVTAWVHAATAGVDVIRCRCCRVSRSARNEASQLLTY